MERKKYVTYDFIWNYKFMLHEAFQVFLQFKIAFFFCTVFSFISFNRGSTRIAWFQL